MALLDIFLPTVHLKFYRQRARARRKAFKILDCNLLFIKQQLWAKAENFRKWERENSDPELCASESTIQTEKQIDILIDETVSEMMDELYETGYTMWFYHVEDPRIFIENPYPGYLDVRRACNYCQHVIDSFSRF